MAVSFKDRLRELLVQNCMSQQQLAQRTGLNASSISNWIHGKQTPRLGALSAIAMAFDITEEQLINGTDLEVGYQQTKLEEIELDELLVDVMPKSRAQHIEQRIEAIKFQMQWKGMLEETHEELLAVHKSIEEERSKSDANEYIILEFRALWMLVNLRCRWGETDITAEYDTCDRLFNLAAHFADEARAIPLFLRADVHSQLSAHEQSFIDATDALKQTKRHYLMAEPMRLKIRALRYMDDKRRLRSALEQANILLGSLHSFTHEKWCLMQEIVFAEAHLNLDEGYRRLLQGRDQFRTTQNTGLFKDHLVESLFNTKAALLTHNLGPAYLSEAKAEARNAIAAGAGEYQHLRTSCRSILRI